MKKQITLCAAITLLLVSVNLVNGQILKTNIDKNYFGVIVGGTLSNISNYDSENRIGFLGGLYWEWKFSEKFSTMPSILYAQRGASELQLAYITIPIVLKYAITDKLAIASGIAWDDILSVDSDDYASNDLKSDEWRIPITLGYAITDHFSIGLNYNISLTDLTPLDDIKLKNNWGSLALAYIITKK